ncbi:rod shape-determining protein MreD [Orbaceae bacterium ESL0721]|nr:rod shape-determining protein MreD [Orbaceae bacterium ESL0721]
MKSSRTFIIWITLFIGIFLQILPWTSSLYMLKPHWVMLILVYWLLALPHRIGIGSAFIMGIILDLFTGTAIGIHAFIFSVIAYLALFRFQLIRNLALWQQSIIIFLLSVCYDLLLFLFEMSIYHIITMSPMILLSSVIDGFLWTWIYFLLRQIRRSFGIK